jgi:hypothetical protein
MAELEKAIQTFDEQKFLSSIYGRRNVKDQADKIRGLLQR